MYEKDSVLFVDDEENILSSIKRGMIDEEFKCFFARSAREALNILEKEKISVIVTDMRMPGMDGLTLLKEVRFKYPYTVRVVLSGYTQIQQVLATINQADIFKFITKPWSLEDEFRIIIHQALDYHRLQRERAELEAVLSSKNTTYQNILKNIEQTIDVAKSSAEGVKQIGVNSFDYIMKLSDSGTDCTAMRRQIGKVRSIFDTFSIACSEEWKIFQISSFSTNVVNRIKSLPGVANVTTKSELDENLKLKGKLNLTMELFNCLFELMVEKSDFCNIRLLLRKTSPANGIEGLECTVQISYANINADLQKDSNERSAEIDRDIGLLTSVYGALLVYMGGSFVCGRSGNDFVAKINFRFSPVS